MSILSLILPEDDASPAKVTSWRWKVAGSLVLLYALVGFILSSMFTGLPKVGQLAWADGLANKADQNQVATVISQQAQLTKQLDDVAAALNEQLAQSKASDIRLLKLKRCKAPANSAERDSLTREIDKAQAEYKKLKGEYYDTPACTDL